MKMIVGMVGIALVGMGAGTIAFGLKIGLCIGVSVIGFGLVIDAIKR